MLRHWASLPARAGPDPAPRQQTSMQPLQAACWRPHSRHSPWPAAQSRRRTTGAGDTPSSDRPRLTAPLASKTRSLRSLRSKEPPHGPHRSSLPHSRQHAPHPSSPAARSPGPAVRSACQAASPAVPNASLPWRGTIYFTAWAAGSAWTSASSARTPRKQPPACGCRAPPSSQPTALGASSSLVAARAPLSLPAQPLPLAAGISHSRSQPGAAAAPHGHPNPPALHSRQQQTPGGPSQRLDAHPALQRRTGTPLAMPGAAGPSAASPSSNSSSSSRRCSRSVAALQTCGALRQARPPDPRRVWQHPNPQSSQPPQLSLHPEQGQRLAQPACGAALRSQHLVPLTSPLQAAHVQVHSCARQRVNAEHDEVTASVCSRIWCRCLAQTSYCTGTFSGQSAALPGLTSCMVQASSCPQQRLAPSLHRRLLEPLELSHQTSRVNLAHGPPSQVCPAADPHD